MAEQTNSPQSVADNAVDKNGGAKKDGKTRKEDGDAAILNMALIKSILDSSTTNLSKDDGSLSRSMGKKGVSFSGIDSLTSSVPDDDKEHSQLVEKCAKLEDSLRQAKLDLSAEKVVRKKKEKNVVKLAKELNKRASDQTDKEKEISRVSRLCGTWIPYLMRIGTHHSWNFS